MIKISVMPKETLVELLHFLAENESFSSVNEKISEGFTAQEVRGALRELARELSREVHEERGSDANAKKNSHLSRKTKEIISYLSSHEEKTLLSAFKLIDK